MNKKDISGIRKEFKLDNTYLKVKEIYNVYVQKETGEVIHSDLQHFNMLDREQQELFMQDFKRVLTGQLDSKLFELRFNREAEDSAKHVLYRGLQAGTDGWKEYMDQIVSRMYKEYSYEMDTVFTFIRAQYFKPTKKKDDESDDGRDDEVSAFEFILGSLNKIDLPKRALLFDYTEKEFKSNSAIGAIINLASPLEGFMFPAFNDDSADVNHILYSAGKAEYPNIHFIKDVLTCDFTATAREDQFAFERVLQGVVGEKVPVETLVSIFRGINKIVESSEGSEAPSLDMEDVRDLLEESGVADTENLETVFKEVVDDPHRTFKATSLVPSYSSKSIKISTKVANVALSPKDLSGLRYVINRYGKKCILIEVDEDVSIGSFDLEAERL